MHKPNRAELDRRGVGCRRVPVGIGADFPMMAEEWLKKPKLTLAPRWHGRVARGVGSRQPFAYLIQAHRAAPTVPRGCSITQDESGLWLNCGGTEKLWWRRSKRSSAPGRPVGVGAHPAVSAAAVRGRVGLGSASCGPGIG